MSNSMENDYFSFMSDRREQSVSKRPARHSAPLAKPLKSADTMKSADTIDFVQETSQIEVVESIASDTMIQRVRTRWNSDR
jgi:hypothetical protein